MTDKKGRLAWGNIVQANEGMDSRTFRVTTAKQKKELAKYMGRPNYTYHTYCQSHQEWHLESHKADMPLHALDMCNDFLAGIQCEALKVPVEVIKQNKALCTNFDSLRLKIGNAIVNAKVETSDAVHRCKAASMESHQGSNKKGRGGSPKG
jgi:hypothetical protein